MATIHLDHYPSDLGEIATAKGSDTVIYPCGRCGGTGIVPEYLQVFEGVCFACRGGKYVTVKVASVRQTLKRRQAKADEAARDAEIFRQRVERLRVEQAPLLARVRAALEAHADNGRMLSYSEAYEFRNYLADGWIIEEYVDRTELILARIDQRVAEDQSLTEVQEGRYAITGEVLGLKLQHSDYGSTLKMLVMTDRGFKIWGTCPRDLDAERGSRVQFTATITAGSERGFGFFKRPTKATIITTPTPAEQADADMSVAP